MKKHITATDLYNYKKCPHRPYLDYNGNAADKVEIHPLIKLLWDAGVQYEDKVIESFKKDHPDKSFVEINKDLPLSQDLEQKTIQAMRDGVDVIYQGVLIAEDKAGRPDLLVKQAGKSKFGPYLYYPMDIKMARIDDTWDNGDEKMKLEHIWQLYFYGVLLEQTQGTRPSKGYIYKTKRNRLPYNLFKTPYGYEEAIENINNYMAGIDYGTEPAISGNCKMCEWKDFCKNRLIEADDITQIYYLGQSLKKGLNKLGIRTVEELSKQDEQELTAKALELKSQGYFYKSMPNNLIKKAVERARLRIENKHILHEKIEFPDTPVEIHYDIEDDPTQDFVYLHGIALVEKGKEAEYIAFFADDFADEKKITIELLDFFRKYKDAPVYHYEKTTLKRLLTKYNIDGWDVFENIFGENGTSIDLMKVINNKTDWPLTSYSLKDICRYLGFQWDAEDAGGAASIVWMNDYLNGQKELKDKILQYNKDDCVATYYLKSKLIELQKDLF